MGVIDEKKSGVVAETLSRVATIPPFACLLMLWRKDAAAKSFGAKAPRAKIAAQRIV